MATHNREIIEKHKKKIIQIKGGKMVGAHTKKTKSEMEKTGQIEENSKGSKKTETEIEEV
jgi:hypothetical protein